MITEVHEYLSTQLKTSGIPSNRIYSIWPERQPSILPYAIFDTGSIENNTDQFGKFISTTETITNSQDTDTLLVSDDKLPIAVMIVHKTFKEVEKLVNTFKRNLALGFTPPSTNDNTNGVEVRLLTTTQNEVKSFGTSSGTRGGWVGIINLEFLQYLTTTETVKKLGATVNPITNTT